VLSPGLVDFGWLDDRLSRDDRLHTRSDLTPNPLSTNAERGLSLIGVLDFQDG
jgi:aminoglycoside/choline kinase family phosphotransferase